MFKENKMAKKKAPKPYVKKVPVKPAEPVKKPEPAGNRILAIIQGK